MTFSEKLRTLRKHYGLSQEKLAEKLGVSRQAVTKWETDGGLPETENLIALSALFRVSIDELISENAAPKPDYIYESVTEYDVDRPKRYDIALGGVKEIRLTGYDGEKLRVRLASSDLESLQSDFKIKIEDDKNFIDVNLIRQNVSETAAKEALIVFIQLPQKYVKRIELTANAEKLEISRIDSENTEFDGRAKRVVIDRLCGNLEINCNTDMDIVCESLCGNIQVNQISATSRITVPHGAAFRAVKRGLGNAVYFEKDGALAEAFDNPSSDTVIELNGFKSELTFSESVKQ